MYFITLNEHWMRKSISIMPFIAHGGEYIYYDEAYNNPKKKSCCCCWILVCCCEQYNITPATTTTTTLTNIIKKYRGLYKMEEKKEMNLHKWLLLALDVLSSCTPFYPYILWHISPQGVRYGLELHQTYV